jgi:hypothetical protein
MAFWKKKKEDDEKDEKKDEEQDEDKGTQRVTGIMQFGADYRDKLPDETPSDEQLKKMYSQDLLKYYTQPEKKEEYNQPQNEQTQYSNQYQYGQYGEQYETQQPRPEGQSRPKSRKPPRIASATRVEKMESDHLQTISERKLEEVPITPEVTQSQTTQPKEEQNVKETKEKEKKQGAKKPLIVRPPGRAQTSETSVDTKKDAATKVEDKVEEKVVKKTETVSEIKEGLEGSDKSALDKKDADKDIRTLEERYLVKKDTTAKVEDDVKEKEVKRTETVSEIKEVLEGPDKSALDKKDADKDIRALEEKYLVKKDTTAKVEDDIKEKEAKKTETPDGNVQKKLAEVMEKMKALKKYMEELKSKGIDVTQAEKLMLLAESFLNTGNLEKAENYINKSRRAGEDLEVRFMMMQG